MDCQHSSSILERVLARERFRCVPSVIPCTVPAQAIALAVEAECAEALLFDRACLKAKGDDSARAASVATAELLSHCVTLFDERKAEASTRA